MPPEQHRPVSKLHLKVGDIIIPRRSYVQSSEEIVLGVSKIHESVRTRKGEWYAAVETAILKGIPEGRLPYVVFYHKHPDVKDLTTENFIKIQGTDWRDLVSE